MVYLLLKIWLELVVIVLPKLLYGLLAHNKLWQTANRIFDSCETVGFMGGTALIRCIWFDV